MNINSEKFVKILGKGHAQFLSKQIADCFDKESYANVKFICKTATRGESSATQQQCLLANKFILAAASKKFSNLLAGTDDEEVTILVPDENFSTLKFLLQYIYSGEIYLNELSEELNLLIDEWDIVSPEVVMVVETQQPGHHCEDAATRRPKKTNPHSSQRANSKKTHLPTSQPSVTAKETVSVSPSVDKKHNLSNHVELIDVSDDTLAATGFVEVPASIPLKPKPVKKVKTFEESLNGYVFLAAYKKKVGDQLGGKPIPSSAKPKQVKQTKTPKITPVEQPESEALVLPGVDETNAKPKKKQTAAKKVDGLKKPKVAIQNEENNLSENEEVSEKDKQDLSLALQFVEEEIKRRKSLTEEARDLADMARRYKVYAKFFLELGALKPIEEKGMCSLVLRYIFIFSFIIQLIFR